MADQQDRPDQPSESTPPAADPAARDDKPPAAKAAKATPPAKAAKATPPAKAAKAAQNASAKAAKKAPAKQPQPKKAPAKAVKKVAPKKAPPKKAPPGPDTPPPPIAADRFSAPPPEPKLAPPPEPMPAPPPGPEPQPEPAAANLADTNGEAQRPTAANEAAAQAKSSVQSAPDSLTGPVPLSSSIAAARLPAVVAIVVALLAILVIRRLRTSTDERLARRA